MIEFQNIQVSDSGDYTCVAKNNAVDNEGNPIVDTVDKTINIECKGTNSLLYFSLRALYGTAQI